MERSPRRSQQYQANDTANPWKASASIFSSSPDLGIRPLISRDAPPAPEQLKEGVLNDVPGVFPIPHDEIGGPHERGILCPKQFAELGLLFHGCFPVLGVGDHLLEIGCGGGLLLREALATAPV